MLNSVDSWELQAGASLQKELFRSSQLSLEAGAGAFLFYRAMEFGGSRRLIPAELPVVSARHLTTGIGLNVVTVPPLSSSSGSLPGVVYLQFTQALER